ncbi:MAG: hypothetical protein ABEJ91_00910 [Candidatus Nanohaloarchaea archaeon]
MEVKNHFLISAVSAPPVVLLLEPSKAFSIEPGLVIYAVAIGTLVDLDHFPYYVLRETSLRPLKEALANPVKTVTDNRSVLPVLPVREKYLPHLVGFPLLLSATFIFSRELFGLTASMLGIHLLSDLYHSWKRIS